MGGWHAAPLPAAPVSPGLASLQFRQFKVIYRRYAGLFFSMCVDVTDNELLLLESIHVFVELLDRYFGNVCELDLVFNFHKVKNSHTGGALAAGCLRVAHTSRLRASTASPSIPPPPHHHHHFQPPPPTPRIPHPNPAAHIAPPPVPPPQVYPKLVE